MIELEQNIKVVDGLVKVTNVNEIQEQIAEFLSTFSPLLQTEILSDSDWTLFKKTKKEIGNQIDAFKKTKKALPKTFLSSANTQIDELIDPLQQIYGFFDSEIKRYEEAVGCGSVLAAQTRKQHAEEKKAIEAEESLIVTFECQTKEQRNTLIDFALKLGAIRK